MMKNFVLFVFSVAFLSTVVQVTGSYFDGQTSWEKDMRWCISGAGGKLFTGDFNGDGRTDLLCHLTSNGHKWVSLASLDGTFSGTTWQKDMRWCYHSGSQLFIGDFNGDGRSDMLCHDKAGKKLVSLANADGSFSGTSWEKSMGWCVNALLLIGDFNGDGRDDLMCHRLSDGYKWISLAKSDGSFPGTTWHKDMRWCYHSGSQLFIGDFNGDGRSDILCHDRAGMKWVSLANADGSFTSTSWEKSMGWCGIGQISIADFNKDGKDDILCVNSKGNKWIALAHCGDIFTGTDWHTRSGWCSHGSSELHIGTFNDDRCADLLCHDNKTGYKWISLNQQCSRAAK